MWVAAPILQIIMGDEFEDSVAALRWIALVPALKATQTFPANVLTGTDRQWARARIMAAAASLNLGANLLLVPRFGWRGAAVSTLLAEAVFSVFLWLAVRRAVSEDKG